MGRFKTVWVAALFLLPAIAHAKPVKYRTPLAKPTCIASGFGYRGNIGIKGASRYHMAWDLRGRCGETVVAAAGGVVKRARYHRGYGYRMEILHADGRVTTYSHMQKGSFKVREGKPVIAGQPIGRVGNTGLKGMACHLHFELKNIKGRKVNPNAILAMSRCGGRRGKGGGRTPSK